MNKFEHLKIELKGMTVNERLHVCNLFNDWKIAVKNRNEEQMIKILLETFLTNKQAKETVKMILNNPEFYGYK